MSLVRCSNNNRGVSLVEVLVALVVFLIGMMAVVRMFPGGFATMKHSENVTLASRLAQAEIERWKGRSSNLPAGILAWGESGTAGVFVVYTDVDPENVSESIPPGGYYFSDANRFRRVHAEATKIPVPSGTRWNGASVYVLGFSPVACSTADPNPDPILVYGGPMRRRALRRYLPDLGLRSYNEYAIDYDYSDGDSEAAVIYLRPAAFYREFVISYSYWKDSGPSSVRMETVLGQSLEVAAGVSRVDITVGTEGALLADEIGFRGIDHRSESLHRQFQELPVTGGTVDWNLDDPYQFALADRLAGVLAFNPLGYGYEELTTRGKEPLTAYIDYTVLDWHIIREERRLPDVFSSPVDLDAKLTLRFIKKQGETAEFDGSTYAGLAPAFGLVSDVLAVDIETGDVYSENEASFVPGTSRPAMQVNYKEGIIRFDPLFPAVRASNPDAVSPFAGRTFRIYYRADSDWAVQVFKAYDEYRPNNDASLNHRRYYVHDGIIYFPRCYAGCGVAVDYSYRLNGEATDRYVSGEAYQISEDTGAYNLCYVDLVGRLRQLHGTGAVVDIRSISKVYGVSVGARVIWRESGRGFLAGRWRKVELQTYLTREDG